MKNFRNFLQPILIHTREARTKKKPLPRGFHSFSISPDSFLPSAKLGSGFIHCQVKLKRSAS